jgi:hypothetical protein
MEGNGALLCEVAYTPARFFDASPPAAKNRSSFALAFGVRVAAAKSTEAADERGRPDLAARLPWRERNHPVWLARRDGKG